MRNCKLKCFHRSHDVEVKQPVKPMTPGNEGDSSELENTCLLGKAASKLQRIIPMEKSGPVISELQFLIKQQQSGFLYKISHILNIS